MLLLIINYKICNRILKIKICEKFFKNKRKRVFKMMKKFIILSGVINVGVFLECIYNSMKGVEVWEFSFGGVE